jgi:hypothetical protein
MYCYTYIKNLSGNGPLLWTLHTSGYSSNDYGAVRYL